MKIYAVQGLAQLDNTRYGYYRKLRWLILIREFFFLPGSIYILWKLRKSFFTLIHVNEITLLPLGIFAKLIFRIPLLVHVRSLQRNSISLRDRLIQFCLAKYVDVVIAIDETVAESLPKGLPLSVIHNGINLNFDSKQISIDLFNQKKRNKIPVVGFFGVLIPSKGIYELVEAMRILKQKKVNVKCLIVGENSRDISGLKEWLLKELGFYQNVRQNLEKLIIQNKLSDVIELIGFVSDVRTIYPYIDVLCFPSYLNAAGRPVFEAAFFGIPSVVAIENPKSDAIEHEITGLAIPKPEPELIADALQRLVENSLYRIRLGSQAKNWAIKNFSIKSSAEEICKLYEQCVLKSG